MPNQASYTSVYDAAQVRLTEFAREYRRLKDAGLPYMRPVMQALDLRLGLERVAKLPAGVRQNILLGYLINTYGLRAVAQDPFLRAQLAPVPVQGAVVQALVRSANNKVRTVNGKLLRAGARLTPSLIPPII